MSHSGPSPLTPQPGGSARHWIVVVGAACLMIAAVFVFLSPSILNPALAESLGIGLSQVMIYNSLMAVSGVIAMSFIAPALFRRIGLRASVVGGGLWVAATLGAVVFVTEPILLYVLGFATGLTFGVATNMAASMLVNTWFEARRGTVMGAVFATSGLGGISAGLVLPALVDAGGWRLGFAVTAALVVALVVLPGLFLIRSAPADVGLLPYGASQAPLAAGADVPDVPGVPAGLAFRTPQFAALALGIVLIATVQAVQQHFAPLMGERGVALAVAGTLISLMALATIVTNIVIGTLNDRRGTLLAVMVALLGQLLAMLGFLFSTGFLPLAVSTTLFAFGAAFPGVLIPILVMQVFGLRDYAKILGPAMAMLPAGMSVGTPLWGVAFDVTGSYTPALVVAAVLTVVAALLLGWTIASAPALRRRAEAGQL
ncbi:MAG: MFS transporter [Actinomycetes bacterium]